MEVVDADSDEEVEEAVDEGIGSDAEEVDEGMGSEVGDEAAESRSGCGVTS